MSNMSNNPTPLTASTLQTAEQNFLKGPPPSCHKKRKGTHSWATGLTYEEMGRGIGAAFAGTESVQGEPAMEWMVSQIPFRSQPDKTELVTFFMSSHVHEKMVGIDQHKALAFAMRIMEEEDDGTNQNQKTDGAAATTPPFAGMVLVKILDPKAASESFLAKLGKKVRDSIWLAGVVLQGKLPKAITDRAYRSSVGPLEAASQKFLAQLDHWHAESGPACPHWYLACVGTDPSCQGQGVGGELMTRVGELADEAQMDCYLECTSAKNCSFYQRFGYQVVATHSATEAAFGEDTTLPVFCMTRPASKKLP